MKPDCCSVVLKVSPGVQSIYSTQLSTRTWHVIIQNLDTYTDGGLQFQTRASCAVLPQCPSPTVSLTGNTAGQPQLCSGRTLHTDPHLVP